MVLYNLSSFLLMGIKRILQKVRHSAMQLSVDGFDGLHLSCPRMKTDVGLSVPRPSYLLCFYPYPQ